MTRSAREYPTEWTSYDAEEEGGQQDQQRREVPLDLVHQTHDGPIRLVVQAVRDVYEGKRVFDPAVRPIVETLSADVRPADLTERELGVLAWTARGLTNKAIAYQLKISPRTVQGHLASIYSKLGVGTRTEAVTRAVQLGLISISSPE